MLQKRMSVCICNTCKKFFWHATQRNRVLGAPTDGDKNEHKRNWSEGCRMSHYYYGLRALNVCVCVCVRSSARYAIALGILPTIQWFYTMGSNHTWNTLWNAYVLKFLCICMCAILPSLVRWILCRVNTRKHVCVCVCVQKMLHCNFNSFYCIWVLYCSKSVITNTHAHTTVINDSLHMCIQSERERTAALSTHISMQLLRSISPLRCCCTRNMRTFGILCMIYAAPNICTYVCMCV